MSILISMKFGLLILFLLQLNHVRSQPSLKIDTISGNLSEKLESFRKINSQNCSDAKPKDCILTHTITAKINSSQSCIIDCSYDLKNNAGPVRLRTTLRSSVNNVNVLVSAVQKNLISSWNLPITFKEHVNKQIYNTIDEVLCPPFKERDDVEFRIETSSTENITIEIDLNRPNITLQLNKNVTAISTPVSPWIYFYQWEDKQESVLIYVRSHAETGKNVCAYLSVQNAKCPVGMIKADIVSGNGRFLSFQRKGVMVARKSLFPDGIFVVILPLPYDTPCTGNEEVPSNIMGRSKSVEVVILQHFSMDSKWVFFLMIGAFVSFVTISSTFVITKCIKSNLLTMSSNSPDDEDRLMENEERGSPSVHRIFSGGLIVGGNAPNERSSNGMHVSSSEEPISNEELEISQRNLANLGIQERLLAITEGNSYMENSSGDIIIRDMESFNNIVAEQDASGIPSNIRNITEGSNPRFMYWWKAFTEYRNKTPETNISEVGFNRNLLIVAVFMALPLSDILRAYMQVFTNHGTEDQCFYNSLCITSFWIFPDFSRIYTNIGYLFCGMGFYRIVKVHQNHNSKVSAGQTLGVTRNYGVFQSLAIGLFIQGMMSSLYHVCPNEVTLRFDMMFMYVDAIILIVAIWGLRHGGVTHHVYPTVGLVGGALLAAESRDWVSDRLFWSILALVHLFFTFTISAMLCYLGTWSFSPVSMLGILKEWQPITRGLKELLQEETIYNKKHWTIIRTLIGFISNFALIVTGPMTDMEVYLYILLVCIVNMILYIINYIITKVFLCKEKGTNISWLCMSLSGVLWITALVFFSIHNTNSELTPASSRGMNSSCILFNVFDTHDLWHLTSAFAMFFSFAGILTMDDDLARRNPKKIPVF